MSGLGNGKKISLISMTLLAKELGITDEALRKRVKENRFPNPIMCNGMMCFSVREVREHLKKHPIGNYTRPEKFEIYMTDEELKLLAV